MKQTEMFGSTMSKESQDITAAYSHNDKFSYQANKSLKNDKARIRNQVLAYVSSQPFGVTCDEVEVSLELSHQSASARMTELKALGLIKQVGKRKTRSGRQAGVWGALN